MYFCAGRATSECEFQMYYPPFPLIDIEMQKLVAYEQLVSERIICRRCVGLTNPSNVDDGRFDLTEIGPWSKWQSNLNASLMVVGQDWGDVRYFTKHAGADVPGNPTNMALRELIGLLGINVSEPGCVNPSNVAFFTNAVLCLKGGGLQADVENDWFANCGSFLRQQVEIVAPRVLVCLGEKAYRGIAKEFAFAPGSFRKAVDSPIGVRLPNGTIAFARYHCGKRIQNTHRTLDKQREDWRRLAQFL